MKNIFILLALCCTLTGAYAQNGDPLPFTINWNDTTLFAAARQTKFVLGWHWMGPEKMINERFHVNSYFSHINGLLVHKIDDIVDSTSTSEPYELICQNMEQHNNGGQSWGFDAEAIQFDPTAPKQIGQKPPVREGDSTGAVFGFGVRDSIYGRLNDTIGATDFNRYTLDTAGAPPMPSGGQIVLQEPVHQYVYWQNTTLDSTFNGRDWYISINLRRDAADMLMDSDTILTIRIPWTIRDTSLNIPKRGFIIFDKIAVSSTVNGMDTLPFGRGLALKLKNNTSSDKTQFVITRSMIPRQGTTGTLPRDITISAFFRFQRDSANLHPNGWLQGLRSNPDYKSDIIKLGLDVRYHGKAKIAIDWLRIEQPYAREVFRGTYDTTRFLPSILHTVTTLINTAKANGKKVRFKSFYGADEPPPIQWLAQRYFTRLLSGHLTTETYNEPYKYAVNPNVRWISGVPGLGISLVSVPYYPTDGGSTTNLGINRGWSLNDNRGWGINSSNRLVGNTLPWDSSGSRYETRLWWKLVEWGGDVLINNSDTNITFDTVNGNTSRDFHISQMPYPNYLSSHDSGAPGMLGAYEGGCYGLFYKNKEIFYDSIPWRTNVWALNEWQVTRLPDGRVTMTVKDEKRPQSGEEMRLQLWTTIIHGGKGYMTDRAYLSSGLTLDTLTIRQTTAEQIGVMNGHENGGGVQWPPNMTVDQIINSDVAGSDFITVGDSTYLDQHIDRQYYGEQLGVPANRLYLGRKSNRRELLKMYDFAHSLSDTLMNLRLTAWFGKGFRILTTGDTTKLKSFIKLDTSLIKTRPVGRTINGQPYYEDSDSTFFDFTLLRDITRGIDTVVYIGALNRRTNPLVRWPKSGGGDSLRFFSTAEYDSMCAVTPSRRYKQGGAREITIPFSAVDTSGNREWVVYHIEELHDGTPPPPGIVRIDTTIHQDSSLAVNFLPGEGKLFRVTVIRPNAKLDSGNLSHSNQRKLVAFPIVNGAGQLVRDTVRYHMTYHKLRHDRATTNIQRAVFYKRSVPVPRQYPADMIRWEPMEYRLTDSVQRNNSINKADCAYPSIVVRQDTNGVPYVYVVYGCVDSVATVAEGHFVVAEHKFRAQDSIVTPGIGHILARVTGTNYTHWATPMINASRNGNYYTWSDSIRGIGLGFKPAYSTNLSDTNYISWAASEGRTLGKAQHPSLNTYSRITFNEDDCALVWQEFAQGSNPNFNRIYYTRLRMVGGTILPYIPQTLFNPLLTVATNTPVTIANLSDRTMQSPWQEYPQVNRGVEDCCDELRYSRWDRVTWQGRHDLNTGNVRRPFAICGDANIVNPSLLFYRNVDIFDSLQAGVLVPNGWWVVPTRKLWSGSRSLLQPTVSQGSMKYPSVYSDSALILNFKSIGQCEGNAELGNIWNIPQGYWSLFWTQSENLDVMAINNQSPAKKIVFNGNYPQLASLPAVGTKRDWQRNRRVFEATTDQIPAVLASSQYFLRKATDESAYAFSGFAKDSVRYMITPPQAAGSYLILYPLRNLLLPMPPVPDTCGSGFTYFSIPDTIISDWKYMAASTPITYYALGTDTASTTLILHRQSTNTKTILPKPMATDTSAMDVTYVISPGAADNYRVMLIRKNTATYYTEELVLDELPLMDLIGAPRRAAQAYHDAEERARTTTAMKGMLSCSLSPNPAREIIRVTLGGTYTPEPVRVVISTLLGETVRVIEAFTLQEIEIPLTGLPTGQYMLRSALTKSELYDPLAMPFVIER